MLGSLGGTIGYTEQAAATVIDGSITLTDADDTQMASALVKISAGLTTGDVLSAVTTGTNITASYNPATGELSLSGTDTIANYLAVLQSVKYNSTSDDPTVNSTSRTITWTVTDANSDGAGAQTSAPQTSTINVTALPDELFTLDLPNLGALQGNGLNKFQSMGTFQSGFDYSLDPTSDAGFAVSKDGVLSTTSINSQNIPSGTYTLKVDQKDSAGTVVQTIVVKIVVGTTGDDNPSNLTNFSEPWHAAARTAAVEPRIRAERQ